MPCSSPATKHLSFFRFVFVVGRVQFESDVTFDHMALDVMSFALLASAVSQVAFNFTQFIEKECCQIVVFVRCFLQEIRQILPENNFHFEKEIVSVVIHKKQSIFVVIVAPQFSEF